MQWNLKGQAVIETLDEKEPCMGHTAINIYPAQYSSIKSGGHFCGNLGSRSPPLVTLEQWRNLQRDLRGLLGNREAKRIWIALNDTDTEGEWADFYNGKVVNFSLPWAPRDSNGGNSENCAVLNPDIGMLFDFPCNDPNWQHACMCERTPSPAPYLTLRGVCSNSAVQDTFYQPMNNLTDLTRLTLDPCQSQDLNQI